MNIKITDYPLHVVEQFENLIFTLHSEIRSNDSVIKQIESAELLSIVPKNIESNFKFSILDIGLDAQKQPVFQLLICPKNTLSNDEYKSWHNYDDTLKKFKSWADIINRFSKIKFKDPILKQYEDEIYEGIKILEDDAEIKAFSLEQQIFLLQTLNSTKLLLDSKEQDEGIREIIKDVEELQGEINKSPKNSVMKKLSSIFAKSKKHSFELFKEVLKDYAKEFLKGQIQNLPHYIETTLKLLESYNIGR